MHHQGGEAESLGREAGEPWVGLGCLSVRAGGREAMMQPHRDMNPESGKPPTAPHLLIPGAPRPKPRQGRGMEGLKPGTRVSTTDPEGPMTRVTDTLVHPGRVQRASQAGSAGEGAGSAGA